MLDVMALGFLIGQIIGRFGNFINIEVYGIETNLPWAMGIGYYGSGAEQLVHPLFLYESLWNLIGLILIYGYKDYRKFHGEMFLWYTAWYGLGRALMCELMRRLRESGIDSLSLEVRESNFPALALYTKLGFSQVGKRPRYYVNPTEDALILRKELCDANFSD